MERLNALSSNYQAITQAKSPSRNLANPDTLLEGVPLPARPLSRSYEIFLVFLCSKELFSIIMGQKGAEISKN